MRKEIITLEEIRQAFSEELSIKESISTKIPTFELVVGLVFHFAGQAKNSFSIEAIRRALLQQTSTNVSPSAFHERLNTQKLSMILYKLFSTLNQKNENFPLRGNKLCQLLKVKDILLLDSASFSLRDTAAPFFSGTFQKAALKWHYCFSLLSGYSPYSDYSSSSSHDSNHFPSIELLKKKLILFDLGYYNYSFFQELKTSGAFFFSRLKTGSSLKITSIEKGLPGTCLGMTLSELESAKFRKQDIDVIAEIKHKKKVLQFRIVGFYNKKERCYHFYLTNLEAEVKKLRKLYNLRWQVELVFKASQQSLRIDECQSSKPGIILNLFFASLIAQTLAMSLFQMGCQELKGKEKEEEALRISFQRVFMILNLLSQSFKSYILEAFERKAPLSFEESLKLLMTQFCDPNKKRKDSLTILLTLFL